MHGLRATNRNFRMNEIHNTLSFQEHRGFFTILLVTQALRCLGITKAEQAEDVSYQANPFAQGNLPESNTNKKILSEADLLFLKDSFLDVNFIKSLNQLLKVLNSLFKNDKEKFYALSFEEKMSFCLSLQRLSKSFLVLLELESLNLSCGKNHEYLLKKSVETTGLLGVLLLYLSKDPHYIIPMVKSGLPWRALEFCMYYKENHEDKSLVHMCEILASFIKNIFIYCNENLNINFPEETFTMERISPEEVSNTLHAAVKGYSTDDRAILLVFFRQAIKILQERMVWILLSDYHDLDYLGGRRETDSIWKFLKVYNSSLEETTLIWNEQIKEDYKYLLREQIQMVNRTEGEYKK